MIMMNRTSTPVGQHTTYCSMRPGCPRNGWASEMMCLWDDWSIQILVLLGLIFQIVLAVFGSHRKTSSRKTVESVIWSSYLLTSYFVTLALSKLTTVSLSKSEEECDTELKALLAPLILLLLGNPDSITAYSVEDNRFGMRRVLNLIITFSFVVWILWRNWKTSIPMVLYFPLFVAGIIKYGETIWALYSVDDENVKMRKEYFDEERERLSKLTNSHKEVLGLEVFLKAYFRFDHLKPHLVDWLKHPFFMEDRNKLIDNYSAEDVFLITDMELGFMYDVLYTKAPVVYTKAGITLRIISYFSLLLALGGFVGLFFNEHWRGPYVIYTFGLLIGVIFLETYQLFKLLYSDWVIIKNSNPPKNPIVLKYLKFLVKRSLNKERWSNRIWQFNFLDLHQSDRRRWFFGILKVCGMAEKFRRYSAPNSVLIPGYLKKLLLDDMKKFEKERRYQPFTKRGKWTLSIHGSLDKLGWSIEMAFDRSIIIWHIATHVCYQSCHRMSNHKEASRLISNYMMFLLVRHPRILSLTTAEITYHHAYTNLMTLLKNNPKDILKVLSGPDPVQASGSLRAVITEGWNVFEEVRTLTGELKGTHDTWELISSVWVEMLCFAAYNCQQYQHAKRLRRGGEIITHVWLLLAHKTDKFNTMKYKEWDIEIEER